MNVVTSLFALLFLLVINLSFYTEGLYKRILRFLII